MLNNNSLFENLKKSEVEFISQLSELESDAQQQKEFTPEKYRTPKVWGCLKLTDLQMDAQQQHCTWEP